MILFLDSCVVIYWVEMAEPYYSKWIKTMQRINRQYPRAPLAVSRLSILECLVCPLRENNLQTYQTYVDFFANPGVKIVELDARVIDLATQIRARYRLKTPDAIQAASALSLEGSVKFITNDAAFTNVPKLSVVNFEI
ncbi:MAG: PIN domain-containing protein [Pseudomonadota bacterium]|nr:PIN domain-containing protein [Gammaproteobacteria bacterium]MBU1559177.1 PIN domain-containing protein [Gammaproteobacteria bacterium]MBU1628992.1 PIN domain-containing protein [Gammaproteobacteria bacterium]MBU1926423.1 PIN domain-containing protein [Gammaproteobacteria bacterium]MBU2545595.1 PIN domain-containing protein [Gammaproteobacteria bacterium]